LIWKENLAGQYVSLRSIEMEDAAYSLQIRQDKKRNQFLHAVNNDINQQRRWIRWQRQAQGDYFFITESTNGEKLGTVGVYDIQGTQGHLGRLLMFGNPFQTFEACLLAMQFAYDMLGLETMRGDVDVRNMPSMHLSEALGFHFGETVHDAELNRDFRWGTAYRSEFPDYAAKLHALIYRN